MLDGNFDKLDEVQHLKNDIHASLMCPGGLSCCLMPLCCAVAPCVLPCVAVQTVAVKEEKVLLSWGKYQATLREPGCYCVNPVSLTVKSVSTSKSSVDLHNVKVADGNGNPLLLSGVVTYHVVNSKKATLDVNSFSQFVLTQGTAVMKQVASMYPYESHAGEPSLKTEATHLRESLINNLQKRVDVAGVQILNFEFNDLAYSPEIAQVMLVRQQAEAMIDARRVIAAGAVGIVSDTMKGLEEQGIILSEREKVQMASNLVVGICSEGGTVRTINVGS